MNLIYILTLDEIESFGNRRFLIISHYYEKFLSLVEKESYYEKFKIYLRKKNNLTRDFFLTQLEKESFGSGLTFSFSYYEKTQNN